MNRASRPLTLPFVLLLALVPATARAADAPPRPRTRAHNAEFVVPDGWLRGGNEYGNLVLVPPDLPAGERVEIHVAPFDRTPRGLRGHLNESVGTFQGQFPRARVEEPAAAGRLPCGADTMTVLVSGEFPQAPGKVAIVHFTEIDGGGGGSSQGVALVASSRELFARYRPHYLALLDSLSLPSRTRLADGTPPLTAYDAHAVNDFIEWVLDVPFTDAQRDALREHFVRAWRQDDRGEIEGVGQILKGRAQLDKVTDVNKKELARQTMRAEIVKLLRGEAGRGDAMSRMVIGIYDAAHQPLAAGDPPLTRQATDATLEILYFMAARVAGTPDVAPGAAQRDQFARQLAAAYGTMPKENREELARMPTCWAGLRVAWPELSRDEQSKLTAAWATSEQVKPIVEQIRAAQAKAAAAAAAAGSQTASAGAPQSDSMAGLKAMQELNRQHETFMALSNISHQMHMSKMQIINNIGSSNYRYEYRTTYRYR